MEMWGRIWPTVSVEPPRLPNCSRRITRTLSEASFGAPTNRRSWWCASTSWTTIRSSPSAAPASSCCDWANSPASLRQLTASVWRVVAVAAARRYVVTSPPRKA